MPITLEDLRQKNHLNHATENVVATQNRLLIALPTAACVSDEQAAVAAFLAHPLQSELAIVDGAGKLSTVFSWDAQGAVQQERSVHLLDQTAPVTLTAFSLTPEAQGALCVQLHAVAQDKEAVLQHIQRWIATAQLEGASATLVKSSLSKVLFASLKGEERARLFAWCCGFGYEARSVSRLQSLLLAIQTEPGHLFAEFMDGLREAVGLSKEILQEEVLQAEKVQEKVSQEQKLKAEVNAIFYDPQLQIDPSLGVLSKEFSVDGLEGGWVAQKIANDYLVYLSSLQAWQQSARSVLSKTWFGSKGFASKLHDSCRILISNCFTLQSAFPPVASTADTVQRENVFRVAWQARLKMVFTHYCQTMPDYRDTGENNDMVFRYLSQHLQMAQAVIAFGILSDQKQISALQSQCVERIFDKGYSSGEWCEMNALLSLPTERAEITYPVGFLAFKQLAQTYCAYQSENKPSPPPFDLAVVKKLYALYRVYTASLAHAQISTAENLALSLLQPADRARLHEAGRVFFTGLASLPALPEAKIVKQSLAQLWERYFETIQDDLSVAHDATPALIADLLAHPALVKPLVAYADVQRLNQLQTAANALVTQRENFSTWTEPQLNVLITLLDLDSVQFLLLVSDPNSIAIAEQAQFDQKIAALALKQEKNRRITRDPGQQRANVMRSILELGRLHHQYAQAHASPSLFDTQSLFFASLRDYAATTSDVGKILRQEPLIAFLIQAQFKQFHAVGEEQQRLATLFTLTPEVFSEVAKQSVEQILKSMPGEKRTIEDIALALQRFFLNPLYEKMAARIGIVQLVARFPIKFDSNGVTSDFSPLKSVVAVMLGETTFYVDPQEGLLGKQLRIRTQQEWKQEWTRLEKQHSNLALVGEIDSQYGWERERASIKQRFPEEWQKILLGNWYQRVTLQATPASINRYWSDAKIRITYLTLRWLQLLDTNSAIKNMLSTEKALFKMVRHLVRAVCMHRYQEKVTITSSNAELKSHIENFIQAQSSGVRSFLVAPDKRILFQDMGSFAKKLAVPMQEEGWINTVDNLANRMLAEQLMHGADPALATLEEEIRCYVLQQDQTQHLVSYKYFMRDVQARLSVANLEESEGEKTALPQLKKKVEWKTDEQLSQIRDLERAPVTQGELKTTINDFMRSESSRPDYLSSLLAKNPQAIQKEELLKDIENFNKSVRDFTEVEDLREVVVDTTLLVGKIRAYQRGYREYEDKTYEKLSMLEEMLRSYQDACTRTLASRQTAALFETEDDFNSFAFEHVPNKQASNLSTASTSRTLHSVPEGDASMVPVAQASPDEVVNQHPIPRPLFFLGKDPLTMHAQHSTVEHESSKQFTLSPHHNASVESMRVASSSSSARSSILAERRSPHSVQMLRSSSSLALTASQHAQLAGTVVQRHTFCSDLQKTALHLESGKPSLHRSFSLPHL